MEKLTAVVVRSLIIEAMHAFHKDKSCKVHEWDVEKEYTPGLPGSVPIGRIGMCNRATALGRRKYPMTFPDQHLDNDPTASLRFGAGEDAESRIRASLRWWLGKEYVSGEVNVQTYTPVKMHGRADAIVRHPNFHPCILEIKNSRSRYLSTYQLYQVLGYMYAANIPLGFIVIFCNNDLHVWGVEADGDSIVIQNHDGEASNVDVIRDGKININTMLAQAQVLSNTLQMADDELLDIQPIAYPLGGKDHELNDPAMGPTWQCCWVEQKPTKKAKRPGLARNSCPWQCHPSLARNGLTPVKYDEEGRIVAMKEGAPHDD